MAAVIAAIAAGAVLFGPAGAQSDPDGAVINPGPDYGIDHITVLDDEGRFTGPGEWPPRPKSATTPLLSDPVEADPIEPSQSELPDSARSARSAPAVQDLRVAEALGDRYWLISSLNPPSTDIGAPKGAVDVDRTETVYFSASNNQTVIVDSLRGQVTSVTSQSPTLGQPPLIKSEREAAIALARQHWEEFGADRIDQLEGFAIEAYPFEGGHYDFRAVYVSFHIDADSRPELITWVDLTNDAIVKAQVDR